MFTGIVRATSRIVRIAAGAIELRLPNAVAESLAVGGSLAVNGVCLTARSLDGETFRADLSPETISRTSLGALRPGATVNVELPVAPNQGLDGHWVLGHVDAVGRIRALYRERDGWTLMVSFPPQYRKYLVDKGSIAVDGVSLTPFAVTEDEFRCSIIPETYEATTLRDRRPGDPVNLEFDILAKYVERMMRNVHHD
jgi:riboflavin synthase